MRQTVRDTTRRHHSGDKKGGGFELIALVIVAFRAENEYKSLCVGNCIKIQSQALGASSPKPPGSLCVLAKGPFHSALVPLSAGFIWGHLNPDLSEREETAKKQISLPFPPAGKGVCPDKTLDGPSAPHRQCQRLLSLSQNLV